MLRERVKFLAAPGGKTSALWWLLGKAAGVETHHVFSRRLDTIGTSERQAQATDILHSVRSPSDAVNLEATVRGQLEQHLAQGLVDLSSAGHEVYFLRTDRTVVSQLLISPGPHIILDAPPRTELDIGTERVFLSYLHTPRDQRRQGAARRLLELVCAEFHRRHLRALIAHVRATNVPSLNAFRMAGWEQIGTLWTPPTGNWLRCTNLATHGITAKRTLGRGRS